MEHSRDPCQPPATPGPLCSAHPSCWDPQAGTSSSGLRSQVRAHLPGSFERSSNGAPPHHLACAGVVSCGTVSARAGHNKGDKQLTLTSQAFVLSPNTMPEQDVQMVRQLAGLSSSGEAVNSVVAQLFFLMGVWPTLYAALLIPAGRSGNKACCAPA